jgi:hypothetical protein
VKEDIMTDEKIITAFKICSGGKSCKKCPYEDYCETGGNLDVLVLDMIERYTDAIERYKNVIKLLEADVAEARLDAFKALGHRLIDMADSNGAVYVGDICNMAVELMRGDNDGISDGNNF